jgi:hypothetical protein
VAGNPSRDAKIIYFLKKRHMFGDMYLEIFKPDGELLRRLPAGKRKGINVVDWRMRLKPPRVTSAGTLDPLVRYAGSIGPAAPEGTYTFKLTKGKDAYEGAVEVIANPDSPHAAEDRLLQQETVMRLYGLLEDVSYVAEAMKRVRDDAKEIADGLEDDDGLAKRLRSFADDVTAMKGTFTVSEEEVQGISGERQLRENLIRLYASVGQYSGRPSQSQLDAIPVYEEGIADVEARWQEFVDDRLEDLNERLAGQELGPLEILSEEEYRKSEG